MNQIRVKDYYSAVFVAPHFVAHIKAKYMELLWGVWMVIRKYH